jgi:3-oxoacyl-[acyl-carrier protein] reductase
MDLGLAGKNVVVTGASSGLGLAVAEAFAGDGANLLLFARRGELLRTHCDSLVARHGIAATAIAGDMTSGEDIARLSAAAGAMKGGPDILVVNTGRPPTPMREALDETDEDRWEAAFRVQLLGAIRVTRAIAPMLIAKGWGRIVAVTSASVMQPMPKHALSTVFRAGATGYFKHLANEIARTGVTVNCVCPGAIGTESLRSSYDVAERAVTLPVGRIGRPEELAAAVAFFASDKAGFITGASLQVDGGQVAALF